MSVNPQNIDNVTAIIAAAIIAKIPPTGTAFYQEPLVKQSIEIFNAVKLELSK